MDADEEGSFPTLDRLTDDDRVDEGANDDGL
jgi:hypothetical protein